MSTRIKGFVRASAIVRPRREQVGVAFIEYALLVALIASLVIGGISALGDGVLVFFDFVQTKVHDAICAVAEC